LNYRRLIKGNDWQATTLSIYASYHHGNQRPYFRCLGVVNGHYFGRRICNLVLKRALLPLPTLLQHPRHQPNAHYHRTLSRANKLRIALYSKPGTAHWIAHKLKGMWQQTYQQRLV